MNLIRNGNFEQWPLGTSFSIAAGASTTSLGVDLSYVATGADQPAATISRQSFTFGDTLPEAGAPHYFLQVVPTTAPIVGTLTSAYLKFAIADDLTSINRVSTLTFWANTTVNREIVLQVSRQFVGGTGPGGQTEVVCSTQSVQLRVGWRKYQLTFRAPEFIGATHAASDLTNVKIYLEGDNSVLTGQAIPWTSATLKFSQFSYVPHGVVEFVTSDDSIDTEYVVGAVGDGVADDTAVIQAAIDASETATRHNNVYNLRRVVLPTLPTNGFYKITAPLRITRSGTILEGQTLGTLIKNVTDGSDVIVVNRVEADEVLETVKGRILYNVRLLNLMLIGTGTTSRAIYANQLGNLVVDVDCTQHPGPSLYQESAGYAANLTGVGFTGCDFGDIKILCQPSQDVVSVTDHGGRSNTYRDCRFTRATVGIDLIDADGAVFINPYFETMNRGTVKTGIRARGYSGTIGGGLQPTKRGFTVIGGYVENCENYFIDADTHCHGTVTGSLFISGGGTSDKIKLSGGGSLTGVNGHNGVRVLSDDVVEIGPNCNNIQIRCANARAVGVATPPFTSAGANVAVKSWCDTEPTWSAAGDAVGATPGAPPTLAFVQGEGFYGPNCKSATFPTGALNNTHSRVLLINGSVATAVGDHFNAIVALKCDQIDTPISFRVNTETSVRFASDTEWNFLFISYKTTLTSCTIRFGPSTTLVSPLVVKVGGLAVAVNTQAVLINTESLDRPANAFQLGRLDIGSTIEVPGFGSPEGVITARRGSIYRNLSSSAGAGSVWRKIIDGGAYGWLDEDQEVFGRKISTWNGLYFDGTARATVSLGTQVAGTGPFSLGCTFRCPLAAPTAIHGVLSLAANSTRGSGSTGDLLLYVSTSGNLVYRHFQSGGSRLGTITGFVSNYAGQTVSLVLVRNGGSIVLYANGVRLTPTESTQDGSPADFSATMSGAYLHAGIKDTADLAIGTFYETIFLNRALTSIEVRQFEYSGLSYSERWGSQTALNSGSFVVGKRYRIVSRTDGSFTTVGSANNNVGTEFVATGTGAGILDAGDTVVQIGAILYQRYNLLGTTQIPDLSSNALHATINGGVTQFGSDAYRVKVGEITQWQIDNSATAGHTRLLLWDVNSGLLQRVKVGANDTGPGAAGRALYLDNA